MIRALFRSRSTTPCTVDCARGPSTTAATGLSERGSIVLKSQGQSRSADSPRFVGVNLAPTGAMVSVSSSRHDEVLLEFERQVGPSPPLIHRHSLPRITFHVTLGTIPRGPATVSRLEASKGPPHRHRGSRHRLSGAFPAPTRHMHHSIPFFEDLEL